MAEKAEQLEYLATQGIELPGNAANALVEDLYKKIKGDEEKAAVLAEENKSLNIKNNTLEESNRELLELNESMPVAGSGSKRTVSHKGKSYEVLIPKVSFKDKKGKVHGLNLLSESVDSSLIARLLVVDVEGKVLKEV